LMPGIAMDRPLDLEVTVSEITGTATPPPDAGDSGSPTDDAAVVDAPGDSAAMDTADAADGDDMGDSTCAEGPDGGIDAGPGDLAPLDGDADAGPGGGRSITVHVTIVPTCSTGDFTCTDDYVHGCAAPP